MQAKSSVVLDKFTDDVRASLKQFANEVWQKLFELEEMASTHTGHFCAYGFCKREVDLCTTSEFNRCSFI